MTTLRYLAVIRVRTPCASVAMCFLTTNGDSVSKHLQVPLAVHGILTQKVKAAAALQFHLEGINMEGNKEVASYILIASA